jgi:hypothetical protein
MVLSIVTALARNLVMVPAAVLRGRVAKDAEVLALRPENAVLRRQIARVHYEPADRIWLAAWRGPSRAMARGLRGHADHAAALAPGTRLRGRRRGDLTQPTPGTESERVCERVVGTLPREILDQIFIRNEAHAHAVLTAYIRHYSQHRPHQPRQELLPDRTEPHGPATVTDFHAHRIRLKRVLDGLINEYHYAA